MTLCKHMACGLLVSLLAGGFVGDSRGAPPKKGKIPTPRKQLYAAVKNLAKAKSYKVSLAVHGGISSNTFHTVTRTTVREKYSGDVYRNLMHVAAMRTFRTPRKGVSYIQGQWRRADAERKTQIMDRLFTFPVEALTKALRHSARGKWVEAGEKREAEKGGSEKKLKDDSDRGATVVAEDKSGGKDGDIVMPTVLRIEIPPKEALNHYLAVEKSGCIGGG